MHQKMHFDAQSGPASSPPSSSFIFVLWTPAGNQGPTAVHLMEDLRPMQRLPVFRLVFRNRWLGIQPHVIGRWPRCLHANSHRANHGGRSGSVPLAIGSQPRSGFALQRGAASFLAQCPGQGCSGSGRELQAGPGREAGLLQRRVQGARQERKQVIKSSGAFCSTQSRGLSTFAPALPIPSFPLCNAFINRPRFLPPRRS